MARRQIGANLSNDMLNRLHYQEQILGMMPGMPIALQQLVELLPEIQEINERQVKKLRDHNAADRSRRADVAHSDSDDEKVSQPANRVSADDELSQREDDFFLPDYLEKNLGKDWTRRYAVIDLDDPAAPRGDIQVYVFAAPLVRMGHPSYNKAFDQHYASALLGPFDGHGRPAKVPVRRVDREALVEFLD